jgi:hypothetical protein
LLRQSGFGRPAGYEDVNDADRLAHDLAMRAVVDRTGLDRRAASTSQMGRFETGWLTSEGNVAALGDLSGAWIDRVHARKPQTAIVLDIDSSVSETHGTQEGSAWLLNIAETWWENRVQILAGGTAFWVFGQHRPPGRAPAGFPAIPPLQNPQIID